MTIKNLFGKWNKNKVKILYFIERSKIWKGELKINCRGNETRKRIITEYIVEPKAHLKLLANQRKNSDAKAIIEDEYYIFTAVRKRDGKEEIIQCGMGAARDFLKLLNHPGLPLFNPLKTDSTIKKDNNQKSNSQEIKVEKWNKTAKQLYNAIMWLITIWDAQPNTPLFEFRDEIVKYKENDPYDSKIKRINTAVKNGGKWCLQFWFAYR